MVPLIGEFLGTLLLILLGNGGVANVVLSETKGHGSGWIVITFGWGMAVFVAVWCVGPMSGAHINPAVTLGLAVAGEFDWAYVPGYIVAQMAGAIAGAVLVYLVYKDYYAATDDANGKLATFSTAPAIRNSWSNLLCEAIGTLVLVLAVLLAVEPAVLSDGPLIEGIDSTTTKIGLGTLGALPVGLLVFSIGLSLGGPTGYAINPARDLGPRFVHAFLPVPGKRDSDWSYAWIPVAGPIAGAVLAAIVYSLVD